jgi:predicted dithiol-disulfide oxidoreductase (DUF899 family)
MLRAYTFPKMPECITYTTSQHRSFVVGMPQMTSKKAKRLRPGSSLESADGHEFWEQEAGDCNHSHKVTEGEEHALSVFFRLDDDVSHTYSSYERGTEGLINAYALLDTTPCGRQQKFEDSPIGWPQKPTYG